MRNNQLCELCLSQECQGRHDPYCMTCRSAVLRCDLLAEKNEKKVDNEKLRITLKNR